MCAFIPAAIAFVPSIGLGDGLISLIIADNLRRNGYEVACYSRFIAELQDWFPHIIAKPFPEEAKIREEFSVYDLIVSEAFTPLKNIIFLPEYQDIVKKIVFWGNASFKYQFDFERAACYVSKISDTDKRKQLMGLAQASGRVIPKNVQLTMVERTVGFCKEQFRLKNVTADNGITPPSSLAYRKYPKRIVLHPESSKISKNWLPSRYLKLARQLRADGWGPVFIASPEERAIWTERIHGEFDLPEFKTVSDLAGFVYESGWMIGNDSGVGHLASNLNIPTTVIFKHASRSRWRPGWCDGIIVTQPFRKTEFFKNNFWPYLISVKKVFNAFNQFVNAMGG